VLFGQDTVLFSQNRIQKFRTPRFFDGGRGTIISLRSRPENGQAMTNVKGDVEKSCAVLIAGCRRTAAAGLGKG